MESSVSHPATHWGPSIGRETAVDRLISEEPLAIRLEGKPYVVVMRTPGDEIAQAAGLLLAEGVVDGPEDFASLGVCEAENTNVVTATLTPERRKHIPDKLDRREYISQTSCGICGKEVVSDLYQELQPLSDETVFDIQKALACLDALSGQQPLRRQTRAAHAAAIYDAGLTCLSIAEDVGRHNALDKAVGKLFLDRRLPLAKLLILSSRISYELVQKAARAKIPVILAYSRPTSLAVALADRLNMTLACSDGASGLYLFCGKKRLKR
ncbi:MAG: formate dehydrogenase accessory sulfurtransferase FdhD [Desulfobacterales bacterium]|nr:formate dehydrogenase accessory sulfurtransferase FdhD [Desulfobacterales bacterium]